MRTSRRYGANNGANTTIRYPNQTLRSVYSCHPAYGTLKMASRSAIMTPQAIEYGRISDQEKRRRDAPAMSARAINIRSPTIRGAKPSINPYVINPDHVRDMIA